ncbi:MAG: hypothetical protein QW172_00650 [Candidatus Bathyarchaeia archaeon]
MKINLLDPYRNWWRMVLNLNLVLKKIDEIVAWLLLTLFLAEMISGYMITRGFISWHYGVILHTSIPLPLMAAFSFHIAVNLRFILIRRGFPPGLVNIISTIAGVGPFTFMIYLDLLHRFY